MEETRKDKIRFCEGQVRILTFTIQKIEKNGISVLHEIDQKRGLNYCLSNYKKQKIHFETRIKKMIERKKRPNKERFPINYFAN